MRYAWTKTGLAIAVMTLGTQAAWAQAPKAISWTVGGDQREAIVYPPSEPAGGRVPLVLSFHGHGDDMYHFQNTDMHLAWPQAVVVYFQGLPSRDGLRGWQRERGQDDDRDLKLVDLAIASLRDAYPVDDSRIYATGFSNGANFTYLLWAERPAVFAAFAPVAARLWPTVMPAVPRPIFHVAGTRDAQILFIDQAHAIDVARQIDGATDKGTSCGSGCTTTSGSADVMTWIHTGGHVYPRGTSERIAKFFREHPGKH